MIRLKLVALFLVLLSACSDLPRPERPAVPSSKLLLVGASDFVTGFLNAISLADNTVYRDILPTHSDSVVRSSANEAYVVNRLGQDNITRLLAEQSFSPRYESATGNLSNPHDIVVVDSSTAVVSLYGKNYLLLIDPSSGATKGQIDLSAYADIDTLPEAASLYLDRTDLYVTVQRLNRFIVGAQVWPPVGTSYLLRIPTSTYQVAEAFSLPYTNPISRLRHFAPRNSLIFCTPALYAFNYALDGGIVEFDLDTKTFSTAPLTETQAGLELSDAILVSATLGFAIGNDADFNSTLLAFNPSTNQVIKTMATLSFSVGGYYSDLAYSNGKLYLADRKLTAPGVRIFDTASLQEITTEPLNVGLPPLSLQVFRE